MSSIDQQFVEFIVKSLVGNPDAVQIERRIDEKGVLLELTVAPEDLGRVIGKRGATAQSLRTLLRALGTKNDARYNLKIVDNGMPAPASRAASSYDDPQVANDSGAQSAGAFGSGSSASDDSYDEPAASTPAQEDENSVVSKTRKELEELDDLDV